MDEEGIKKLAKILLSERKKINLEAKNEKIKQILLLLAGGTALATALVLPGTVRLFKDFFKDESEWKEWKMFNVNYLRRTLRKLEKDKMIKVRNNGQFGEVLLTENGRKKLMQMNVENITISKPAKWDGKWRMVFYDVFDGRKAVRERFRHYLKSAGFYPWQKSVYLHAYPCEREVEFLRDYLGISGEVRMIIADEIENDQQFRDYFGV